MRKTIVSLAVIAMFGVVATSAYAKHSHQLHYAHSKHPSGALGSKDSQQEGYEAVAGDRSYADEGAEPSTRTRRGASTASAPVATVKTEDYQFYHARGTMTTP